jgi:hypothetical protein
VLKKPVKLQQKEAVENGGQRTKFDPRIWAKRNEILAHHKFANSLEDLCQRIGLRRYDMSELARLLTAMGLPTPTRKKVQTGTFQGWLRD